MNRMARIQMAQHRIAQQMAQQQPAVQPPAQPVQQQAAHVQALPQRNPRPPPPPHQAPPNQYLPPLSLAQNAILMDKHKLNNVNVNHVWNDDDGGMNPGGGGMNGGMNCGGNINNIDFNELSDGMNQVSF
eukprot:UN12406